MPVSIKVMAKSAALSPVLGLFGFSFSFTGVLSGLFTGLRHIIAVYKAGFVQLFFTESVFAVL